MSTPAITPSHGGILFPLEPFRPKMLAAALSEGLVAKARNITDAKLHFTRHPELGLIYASITGSTVEDPGQFWRENADLAMYASQVLPRQCFLYFVVPPPERREGFMVAQRGQVLAADEGTDENMPADAPAADWPVARLAAQIGTTMAELESGFAGGPSIELSLLEPTGDEETLLMTLAGQPPSADDGPAPGGPGGPPSGPGGPPSGAGAAPARGGPAGGPAPANPSASPAGPKGPTAGEDKKRRANEQLAEAQVRDALAEKASSGLRYAIDEIGIIVAPTAELGDTDILGPYAVRSISGDPPPGIPRELTDELQGKRADFAVAVEFLSEVFTEDGPLNKAIFEERATASEIGGASVKTLEVLAPRLGSGTFIRRERAGVFVSRRPDMPFPAELVTAILDAQS